MANKQNCSKCYGKGNIKAFGHVQGGICFNCKGTGKVNAPRKRKPSKAQIEREAQRQQIAARNAIRQQKAFEMYKDDPRISVANDHPWIIQHCQQLAYCDNTWETLA
jgi:hypothetical protein